MKGGELDITYDGLGCHTTLIVHPEVDPDRCYAIAVSGEECNRQSGNAGRARIGEFGIELADPSEAHVANQQRAVFTAQKHERALQFTGATTLAGSPALRSIRESERDDLLVVTIEHRDRRIVQPGESYGAKVQGV